MTDSRTIQVALLAVALWAARTPAQTPERLGTVHFANSGASAAQPAFLRGVALAHSFSQQAPPAFREAERIDPRFALAYYMEAYSWRDPLGRSEKLDSARGALRRLAPTRDQRLARTATARERAWGAAIEALFADDSTPARVAAFADSMRGIVRNYPDDVDALVVASFALQSIPRVPLARRAALNAEAATFAERAFALAPDHPGAAHAMIHVFDDNHPATATRALAAARAYSAIAADNTHALHMPSHIFLQLGVWDGVELSNRNALALSAREREGSAAPPSDQRWRNVDWHSLNWLYYSLVQQGRLREARAINDSVNALLDAARPGAVDSLGSPDARLGRGMRALQRASVLLDPDEYGRMAPRLFPGDIDRIRSTGVEWIEPVFLPGLAAAIRGDTATAIAALRRIRAESAAEPSGTLRTQRAAVWTAEIESMMARAHGDTATALGRLRTAAVEDTVSIGGPPRWWPAGELLATLLLAYGHPREAAAEFAATLERFPNRASAQLGLARARRAAGDRTGAIDAYRKLESTWARADEDLRVRATSERGADAIEAQKAPAGTAPESTAIAPHWTGVFGVHLGTPAKVSAVFGIGRVLSSHLLGQNARPRDTSHADRDVFAAVEPGLSGARLSLGYGAHKNMNAQGATFLNARVSAYRRWSGDSSRIYMGPELSASGIGDIPIGVRLGALFRASGPTSGNRLIVPLDFAIGW